MWTCETAHIQNRMRRIVIYSTTRFKEQNNKRQFLISGKWNAVESRSLEPESGYDANFVATASATVGDASNDKVSIMASYGLHWL